MATPGMISYEREGVTFRLISLAVAPSGLPAQLALSGFDPSPHGDVILIPSTIVSFSRHVAKLAAVNASLEISASAVSGEGATPPMLSTVRSASPRISEELDSTVRPLSAKAAAAGFQNMEDMLGPPAAVPAIDMP